MKVGDVIISEGHRFTVSGVTSRNFVAIDETSGRTRSGYVVQEHGSGTDVEWLDGDPKWHEKSERPRPAARYTPPPEPDANEAARPDRFSRDPFDD